MFHCLEHTGGRGGATLLVDGFAAAEQLRIQDPEAFEQLATDPVRHGYKEPGYDLKSLGTILQIDPHTKQLRNVR